jgi:putative transposase
MFTETDLTYYCNVEHKLPSAGADYLFACFGGEGSRPVGAHARGNVVSWVPSVKLNNKTFATESRGPERALNTLAQFDSNVLWYGDQPEPIDIERTYKNGQKRRGSYTADGISFTPKGPIVYEAKTASKIEHLLTENPNDWKRLECGAVEYLPA